MEGAKTYSLAFEIDALTSFGYLKRERWDLGEFDSLEEAKKARWAVKEYHERMSYDFDAGETSNPALVIYSREPGKEESREEVWPL